MGRWVRGGEEGLGSRCWGDCGSGRGRYVEVGVRAQGSRAGNLGNGVQEWRGRAAEVRMGAGTSAGGDMRLVI